MSNNANNANNNDNSNYIQDDIKEKGVRYDNSQISLYKQPKIVWGENHLGKRKKPRKVRFRVLR